MITNFSQKIEYIRNYGRKIAESRISVIVVSYNNNLDLVKLLDSLKSQTYRNFELILVDAGKNEAAEERFRDYDMSYIKLKESCLCCESRNIGLLHATSQIACFLDGDALADRCLIEAHLKAYEKFDIIGLRGKVLPKTNNIFNAFQRHYDLGNSAIEMFIDMEGNCSFKRKALIDIGGFNLGMFHHEGIELTYRLIKKYRDKKKLIYYPGAIIYHDYGSNLCKYLRKRFHLMKMNLYLKEKCPEIFDFVDSYQTTQVIKEKKINFLDKIKLLFIIRISFWFDKLFKFILIKKADNAKSKRDNTNKNFT